MSLVRAGDRTTVLMPSLGDLNTLYRLLEHASDKEYGLEDVTDSVADYFGLSSQEATGHLETAEYLSLVGQDLQGRYYVTESAIELLNAHIDEKRTVLAKLVLNSWIFVELIELARRNGSFTQADINTIIATVHTPTGTQRYTSTTIGRRAQTIKTWLKWLTDEIGCFSRDGDNYKLK